MRCVEDRTFESYCPHRVYVGGDKTDTNGVGEEPTRGLGFKSRRLRRTPWEGAKAAVNVLYIEVKDGCRRTYWRELDFVHSRQVSFFVLVSLGFLLENSFGDVAGWSTLKLMMHIVGWQPQYNDNKRINFWSSKLHQTFGEKPRTRN